MIIRWPSLKKGGRKVSKSMSSACRRILMSMSVSSQIFEVSVFCFDDDNHGSIVGESKGNRDRREVGNGKGENLKCRRPGVVISNYNKINVGESRGKMEVREFEVSSACRG